MSAGIAVGLDPGIQRVHVAAMRNNGSQAMKEWLKACSDFANLTLARSNKEAFGWILAIMPRKNSSGSKRLENNPVEFKTCKVVDDELEVTVVERGATFAVHGDFTCFQYSK